MHQRTSRFRRCRPTSFALVAIASAGVACGDSKNGVAVDAHVIDTPAIMSVDPLMAAAQATIEEGRHTFRFDTFGDEDFWGGTLHLNDAISGVSPKTALAVGLKVDVDAVPAEIATGIQDGSVSLDDPANTLALIKANAVIGVTGMFDGTGKMASIGIQCALCHSTVDDSFAPGIGHRLDGWANRDLDVGAIVGLAPDLSAPAAALGVPVDTLKTVLASWGPGRFDAEVFLDGKAFRPDGKTAATLIPPAFNLTGVDLHTSTGWGSLTYWNAFVANIEMHGKGNFFDPRLDDATKFPVAAKNHLGHLTAETDLITPKLPALHFYQLALRSPPPPAGSFDATLAAAGDTLFSGKAKCAGCHVEGTFSEPGWNMHTAADIGIDDFQASRSPDDRYRTTPLRGLWTHTKGGFYHDGRFATLADVVVHYNSTMALQLTADEQAAIVEYLKSL